MRFRGCCTPPWRCAKTARRWDRWIRNNLDEPQRPRLIHVMDREGDIHEVLEMISASADGAVIRCVQNRKVAGYRAAG